MTEGKGIEHMKKGRCKKALKVKTPAKIYQLLEGNPAPGQWKLILADSISTPTVPGWWIWNKGGYFSKTMIPNTAKEILNWFQKKKIKLLEWPGQSTDLNPIENNKIEDSVEERAKITPEQRSVSPYRRRLEAVITNKDFCTKY